MFCKVFMTLAKRRRYQFTYSSSIGLINLRRRRHRQHRIKKVGIDLSRWSLKMRRKTIKPSILSLIMMTFKMTFINLMSVLNEHKWCFNNKQLDFNEAFNFSRGVYVLKFLKNSKFFGCMLTIFRNMQYFPIFKALFFRDSLSTINQKKKSLLDLYYAKVSCIN